jgi:inhibitor of KinA sporulation pathway (predicted exonuclease)
MHSHYLVIDFEATCNNDRSFPKHEMEIIEIGAVMVEPGTFKSVGEYQSFIGPIRHPELTPFCTALTSITQAMLDPAPGFVEVSNALSRWANAFGTPLFCSWGNFDRNQLRLDCEFHSTPIPFADHRNLKELFSTKQELRTKQGMQHALTLAGLALTGTHHRGIDDARNIAKLLPFIFGDAKVKRKSV